jgi:hypothetical protein
MTVNSRRSLISFDFGIRFLVGSLLVRAQYELEDVLAKGFAPSPSPSPMKPKLSRYPAYLGNPD